MRVLLDECLPRRLKQELPGHEVATVPEAGWAGRKNGELLKLAAGRFDVFVTIDASIPNQQDVSRLPFVVVTLHASNNRIEALRPIVPRLLEALKVALPGQRIQIRA